MKKLSITLALLLMVCVTSFAQTVKGSPMKAKAYLDKGDLKNAKLYIDAYLDSEKYKKKEKVGPLVNQLEIYMAIAMSEKEEDKSLLDNPMEKVIGLFDNIKEKTGGKGSDYEKVFEEGSEIDFTTGSFKPSMLQQFRNYYFQKAADAYNNEEDYETALINFENAYKVLPTDTPAVNYAFIAARQAEDEEAVTRNGEKLISMKFAQPSPYLVLSYNAYAKGKEIIDDADDTKDAVKKAEKEAKPYFEKMLEYANKGIENVHDTLQADLQEKQTEAYGLLGQMDKVIEMRKKEVEANPKKKESMFKLAYAYDETGKKEEALKYYMRALELDSDFYAANMNVAVIYLDKAKVVFKEMDDLLDNRGKFTDQKKGDELGERYDKISMQALPYLEKAHKAKPNDLAVMQRLMQIYRTLEMDEKAKSMAEKINATE